MSRPKKGALSVFEMSLYFKHETAVIDEGARIGAGTRIWHWVHVCPRAVIGENCILGQGAYVGNDVTIGNRVKIQNQVSVYDQVHLEDEVFCGPSVVFTNVINPRAGIDRKNEFRPTRVKVGATLGANSTLLCGITVGRYAFIGAGSVVTRDVPDYALVVGNPARQRGWMSCHGSKLLRDIEPKLWYCPETQERYEEWTDGAGGIHLRPVSPTPLF